MKKTLTILIIFFISTFTFAQKEMDKPFMIWNLQTPVISVLDLRSGELKFTVSLKENPNNIPYYNETKNAIYALTRHYAYKIDASNGEVLIEYQYTDILQQKASDLTDPNLMLIPTYFDKNGIALFYNMNEQVQNQLNGRGNIVTIKKASTENQTTTDFMTLDRSIHSSMIGLEGKLYLNRVFNTGDSKIVVDISNIDKYQIVETLDIPLALNENKYGLTIDKINSATLQHSQGDNIKVFLSEPYDASTSSVKSYLYTYNIVQNKKVSLTKYDMANIMDNVEWTFDCKKDFERTIIIPEKPPKPKVPEIFSPKRYNKKARAEADQINAERQKKFLQELDEYSKQLTDNSGYSVNLFLNNNGTKTLIKKFEGTMGIALYEDQFVFYADELEYVMYDITKDQIIWSIPK